MFTGIVRELGHVVGIDGNEEGVVLRIDAPVTSATTGLGDSIAIDGVCLTAEAVDDETIRFHAVAETLSRTTLGRLAVGDAVNVEPALRAGEPLGGHIVQGHVDGVGTVRAVEPEGDGVRVAFEAPPEVLRYCVEKGSVTVSGVSLTIAGLDETSFEVALVPHTLAVTTLGSAEVGTAVNLEVDVLAKYVERLVGPTTMTP
jgi:riboflavin synthase